MAPRYRIESGPNTDRMGNRVMPLYRTEVWLVTEDGTETWLSKSVGWKPIEVEDHAVERANERVAREDLA